MNKKQKILIAGAALFAALFLFSGVMLVWQHEDGRQSAETFTAVADMIQPVEVPQPGNGDSTEKPDPTLIALEKYAEIQKQKGCSSASGMFCTFSSLASWRSCSVENRSAADASSTFRALLFKP